MQENIGTYRIWKIHLQSEVLLIHTLKKVSKIFSVFFNGTNYHNVIKCVW